MKTPSRALAALALTAALLVALVRASAPDETVSGGIDVRETVLRHTPGAWRLDARADIELPRAIRAGLDSGVPLEFVLEVRLAESRPFRRDAVLLDVTRRYGLVYYELTRHYRVRSLDDGTGRNYRSLGTALDGLGRFRGVALGDPETSVPIGSVGPDPTFASPLRARLSLRLDGRALPLPLQSPFGSAWRLASEPRVWTLPVPREAAGEAAEGRDPTSERAS